MNEASRKEFTRMWRVWLTTDDGKGYEAAAGDHYNQLRAYSGKLWCHQQIIARLESELAASLGREEALRIENERLTGQCERFANTIMRLDERGIMCDRIEALEAEVVRLTPMVWIGTPLRLPGQPATVRRLNDETED